MLGLKIKKGHCSLPVVVPWYPWCYAFHLCRDIRSPCSQDISSPCAQDISSLHPQDISSSLRHNQDLYRHCPQDISSLRDSQHICGVSDHQYPTHSSSGCQPDQGEAQDSPNLLRPSEVINIVQVMDCCLFNAKPLPESVVTYWTCRNNV